MNAVDVYNTVNEYLIHLRNDRYGDNIEYIEAYDGRIIVHFKREYLEKKITDKLTVDIARRILNIIWGTGVTNDGRTNENNKRIC